MTQSELKTQLNYNPETGDLTWLASRPGVKVGTVAGSPDKYGYIVIGLKRKKYKAHRLAFLYMTGEVPAQCDHINHEKTDNRWINLRHATSSINQKNKSMRHDNKSGFTGVIWNKASKKWLAQIAVDGRYIYLGLFAEIEDAIAARKQANIKHNFHANHGSL